MDDMTERHARAVCLAIRGCGDPDVKILDNGRVMKIWESQIPKIKAVHAALTPADLATLADGMGLAVVPIKAVQFIAHLFDTWREEYWSDIDGCDLQDWMIKAELLGERPATEQDCADEWAAEWDYEVGDRILVNSDTLNVILAAGRIKPGQEGGEDG